MGPRAAAGRGTGRSSTGPRRHCSETGIQLKATPPSGETARRRGFRTPTRGGRKPSGRRRSTNKNVRFSACTYRFARRTPGRERSPRSSGRLVPDGRSATDQYRPYWTPSVVRPRAVPRPRCRPQSRFEAFSPSDRAVFEGRRDPLRDVNRRRSISTLRMRSLPLQVSRGVVPGRGSRRGDAARRAIAVRPRPSRRTGWPRRAPSRLASGRPD